MDDNILNMFMNPAGLGGMYLVLHVDRNNLIEDTLKQIQGSNVSFKKPLKVVF